MGFCVQCGRPKPATGRFCGSCGAAFDDGPPVEAAPMPPPPPPPAASSPLAGLQRPVRMRVLGNWVMGLLIGIAALGLLEVIAAAAQWSTWQHFLDTPAGSFAEVDALDAAVSAEEFHTGVVGFSFFATLAVGIVFIVWLVRAVRNTERFGATGGLTSGWAIGSWFIPLANLVLPAVVVTQTLRASDPALPHPVGTSWRRISPSALAIVWWICFSLVWVTGAAANAALPGPDDPLSGFDAAYGLYLVSAILSCAAAILGVFVVRTLTARQEQRITGMSAAEPRASQHSAWAPPAASQPGSCPTCGTTNSDDATSCWKCGTPTLRSPAPDAVRLGTPVTIVAPGGNVVRVVSAYPKDGGHDE